MNFSLRIVSDVLPDDEKTEKHKDCGFEAGGNEQERKTNAKKEVWPIGGNL